MNRCLTNLAKENRVNNGALLSLISKLDEAGTKLNQVRPPLQKMDTDYATATNQAASGEKGNPHVIPSQTQTTAVKQAPRKKTTAIKQAPRKKTGFFDWKDPIPRQEEDEESQKDQTPPSWITWKKTQATSQRTAT